MFDVRVQKNYVGPTLTWRSRLYALLGLPQVVITGYVLGQVRGNDGHQEVHIHVETRGHTPPPPTCSQKRGSVRPLLRRGAVSPNNVPEKKHKKGVRPRHGLRASCQRFITEFGAGRDTWERLPRACLAHALYLQSAITPTQGSKPFTCKPFTCRSERGSKGVCIYKARRSAGGIRRPLRCLGRTNSVQRKGGHD